MFGFGIFKPSYYSYMIDVFGGMRVSVLYTLFTRLVVGIGWYAMLKKAGKRGWYAFIPLWGEMQVFRAVYDDLAFSAIFAGSSFVAWVGMMGIEHPMVSIFWFINGVFWWIKCLFTCSSYHMSYFFWPIYALIPWAGALIFGFSDAAEYKGPWDPQTPAIPDRKAQREKAERRAAQRAERRNRGKGKR